MTLGTGGIVSSASNAQTLNVPITLSGVSTISNSGAGTLTLGGSLAAQGNLTFAGSGPTVVSGPSFVAGGNVTISGGANVGISAPFAPSGNVTIASGGSATISGPVSLPGPLTFTNNASSLLNISGGLNANSNLLTIAGSGATTISGAGFTNSVGATVNSGAGVVTISAPVTLSNSASFTNNGASALNIASVETADNALTITGSGNTVISGAITDLTGSGSLIKTGSGMLTLSGSSGYGGGTTLTQGTLDVQNASALGIGNVSAISSSSPVKPAYLHLYSTTAGTIANNITTSGNGNGGSENGTVYDTGSGIIQNDLGNNTLSGMITVTNGGGMSVYKVNGGSLTLSGTVTTGVFNGSGNLFRTLDLGGIGPGTISGLITQSNGTNYMCITKIDSGLWTLSGTQNTWTGPLQVGNGTLAVATLGDGGTGSNGTGAITLGSSISNTATLQFIGSSGTTSRQVTLGGPAAIDASGSTPLVLDGPVSLAAGFLGDNLVLTGDGAGEDNGAIDIGTGSLTKNGVGTWTLGGDNTYSGGTYVTSGELILTNNDAILDGSSLTVGNASAFPTEVTATRLAAVPEPGTLARVGRRGGAHAALSTRQEKSNDCKLAAGS